MTLRDTELIGKKLVKAGFFRSSKDHQAYRFNGVSGSISLYFNKSGETWKALFVHAIDYHTLVEFDHHEAVFTPEWVIEEHKKLQAIFKFLRL